jgi:uncharacterized protein (DUF1015 family)
MEEYLENDVFEVYKKSYIYVERTLLNGTVRPGLIGAVDLETYDYNPGSVSAVRATEKTVLERIPPRQRVRKDASIEFPHVLMLADDDQKMLIEPITAIKDRLFKIYDFDLMVQHLMETDSMTEEDAIEFIEYNTIRACPYFGDNAPIILRKLE